MTLEAALCRLAESRGSSERLTLDAALRRLSESRESSGKLMGAAFIKEESVVRYDYEEMDMEACAIVMDEGAALALSNLARTLEDMENQGVRLQGIPVSSKKVSGVKVVWGDEFMGQKYAFGDPEFPEPVPLGDEFAPCSLADFEKTEKVIRENSDGSTGENVTLEVCADGIYVDDNWVNIGKFRKAMMEMFAMEESAENHAGINPA